MAKEDQQKQEIIQTFQLMRNEQRSLMAKISELEQEINDHKVVIETLEDVKVADAKLEALKSKRKCFRMIGGVLVEKTVDEILPTLVHNKTQLTKVVESMNEKLMTKGKELNDFREKHSIKIKGQDDHTSKSKPKETSKDTSSGVLVDNKS